MKPRPRIVSPGKKIKPLLYHSEVPIAGYFELLPTDQLAVSEAAAQQVASPPGVRSPYQQIYKGKRSAMTE